MDSVPVTEEREAAPDWATDSRRGVDQATQGNVRMATQPQLDYIKSLVAEKDLSSLPQKQQEWLTSQPAEQWVFGTSVVSFTKARSILDTLIPLKKKPVEVHQRNDRFVPAGRYAVDSNEGELRFYQVWRPKDNPNVVRVYVMHGPDQSALPRPAAYAILEKIWRDGVREAAIRYGMEIGACSNCGRRLTNRISRELGIGPICGGRMFGEDGWKDEVKTKRAEISARGEDPDEEFDEDEDPQDLSLWHEPDPLKHMGGI